MPIRSIATKFLGINGESVGVPNEVETKSSGVVSNEELSVLENPSDDVFGLSLALSNEVNQAKTALTNEVNQAKTALSNEVNQAKTEILLDNEEKHQDLKEDTMAIKEDTSEMKTTQVGMVADVAEMKENQEVMKEALFAICNSPGIRDSPQVRKVLHSHLKGAPSKTPARGKRGSSSALPPRSTAKKSKQAEETHLYRQSDAAKEAAEMKKCDGRFHH